MSKQDSQIQGEGDYEAARRYDKAAQKFVKDGKVAAAAEKAKPGSPAEKKSLEEAEQAGLARAKEEDPEVRRSQR